MKKPTIRADYLSFKSMRESDIRNLFKKETIHCVKCKETLKPQKMAIDYSIQNSLSIDLKNKDGKRKRGVPAYICGCGYKNTLLKLMNQFKKYQT